jgi:hypothetical protein
MPPGLIQLVSSSSTQALFASCFALKLAAPWLQQI